MTKLLAGPIGFWLFQSGVVVLVVAVVLLPLMAIHARLRPRPRQHPAPPPARPPAPPRPQLVDDPELARLFQALDPNFARNYPSLAAQMGLRAPDSAPPDPPRPVPQALRPDHPVTVHHPWVPAPAPAVEPVATPAEPRATQPDPELLALVRLWPRLAARDRRELLAIARLKLDPD